MKTHQHFKEAHDLTGDASALLDPTQRPEYVAEYLGHLEEVFAQTEVPSDPSPVDSLAYGIFNRELPLEERREYINKAIDGALTMSAEATSNHSDAFDGKKVKNQAEGLSAKFVERMVSFADDQTGATKNDGMENFKQNMSFLFPEEETPENKAVAALTLFGVVQPYLVDRLLELDVYDPATLKEQIDVLRNDCAVLTKFAKSASAFLEFTATGNRTHSDSELADQLFGIGPLFAQIGQSFSENAAKVDETDATSETVANIAKAFQEGIAMPSAEQQQVLTEALPEGLDLQNVFSSAKIAYVAKTTAQGKEMATKIKRPGVESALADNSRMFTLMTDILQRYIETHTGNSELAERYGVVKDALPFVLGMLERDMLEEMDFEREATMQRRGAAVLARHDGIVVPSVAEEYSDKDHITMDLVPSERIEDLAANPEYLKNVMVLVLQGRRSGFLHGDMHGGNIKAVANDPLGRLVAFDWGKSLELPSGFEKNVVNLVVAVMRKNPSAMAKAFREVQNADDSQAELGDLELAALDAIEEITHSSSARKQERQQKMGKAERKLQETADIITNFSALVAKRHQAGLDVRYITYMKSMTSLATIVKAELAKPEYGNKRFRNITLLKSAATAVREVYRKK